MSEAATGRLAWFPCLLALALSAAPLAAAPAARIPGRWQSFGPDGGLITSLAVGSGSSRIVYAGGWGGVFRSSDGGATWTPANRGLSDGSENSSVEGVTCLAIDPAHPSTIYAGRTVEGVVKSTDGGAHWRHVERGLTNRGIQSLALDPRTPGRLFVGTFDGLFRSDDGGETWRRLTEGLPASFPVDVRAVAIDPRSPQTVYTAMVEPVDPATSRLWKSLDGGTTWRAISSGPLLGRLVSTLAVSSGATGTIYAGTEAGVFKTTNGGTTWTATGLTAPVRALVAHPTRRKIVYAATYEGVFRTVDGGVHWQRVTEDMAASPLALAILPDNPAVLYAGTSLGSQEAPGGVFKSRDAGATWHYSSRGLSALSAFDVIVDPQDSRNLWLTSWLGLYRSSDRGATWVGIKVDGDCAGVRDFIGITLDPADSKTLYLSARFAGDYRLCRTADGGATWEKLLQASTELHDVWLDPKTPSTLYAYGSGIWRSTNAGASWTPPRGGSENLGFFQLLTSPQAPDTFYGWVTVPTGQGGFFFGLARSTDGGATWILRDLPPGSSGTLALDPDLLETLYTIGSGRVFVSRDGGDHWSEVSADFAGRTVGLAIDPAAPDFLYAQVYTDGLYESADRGATWHRLGQSPDHHFLAFSLAVDPKDPRRIYIGSSGGGLLAFTKAR
jgi:photosystem II stability/assembly factor-like uncharacterized protein